MIYLDHNATSPIHPKVLEAMLPWFERPANASSVHHFGRRAAAAIEVAAADVAALVGMEPKDVVFTSGATEANSLWFHAARELGWMGKPIGVGATEHPSVFAAVGEHERLEVDPTGAHLSPPSGLAGISVMAANHETGVRSPLERFEGRAGWMHVDATAAAGRMPLDLSWTDGVTLSAHKMGGPLGVGALLSRHHELPAIFAGSQQRGRRAGTLNTPGIVGFGMAARLAKQELDERVARWARFQARLERCVEGVGGRVIGEDRLPTVVNVVFAGLPAEAIVQALDLQGVAVSAGSACASGSVSASPVLLAMREVEPSGGVRFSMGWSTTEADIIGVEAVLPSVLEGARLFL